MVIIITATMMITPVRFSAIQASAGSSSTYFSSRQEAAGRL